uniref:Pentatricopeptide repeat-containing protein n=1 Tax=Kalanchoe fedtschenkoi TaxID=63787 RepID=A0A7N0UAG5_KALFE
MELQLRSCKTIFHLQQLHAHIIRKGLEQDLFILSRFICICNSLCNTAYAASVFARVSTPSSYLWNCLIKGLCENSSLAETQSGFVGLRRSGGAPDCYTYSSLIKACANEGRIEEGMMAHGGVIKCGANENVYVGTCLIDMYGKCGEVGLARKVFDEMVVRNVVSWTALLFGYAGVGDMAEAKNIFDKMPGRNSTTWNAMIKGFVKSGELNKARRLFDEMPVKNAVSYTILIDGYARDGDMAYARCLFDQAVDVDIVAWSALISGYVKNGQPYEAVKMFEKMCSQNVKADEFIMVSLMSACSKIGIPKLAEWVDAYVCQSSIDHRNYYISAALVDMNAKCGNMDRATVLFEEMPRRNLVSYCSMMQGFSIHGCGAQAVGLFRRMLDDGLTPDGVAFTVILTACCDAGLVDEGCHFFNLMTNQYSIAPSPDHYACMVNLYGRAGQL